MKIEVKKGEFYEGDPWEITSYDKIDPEDACSHCFSEDKKDQWGRPMLSIRAAVVATNEGGCNGTAVCLDCILETAKENGLTK